MDFKTADKNGILHNIDENPDHSVGVNTYRHANKVALDLCAQLDEIGIEWFRGGSSRFGYSTRKSDVDLFVLIPDDFVASTKANKILFDNFGAVINKDSYHNTGDQYLIIYGTTYWALKDSVDFGRWKYVDVILFNRPLDWAKLAAEHDLVEEFLELHPELREYVLITYLSYNGKRVYKSLLALANKWFYGKENVHTAYESEGSEN